MESKGTSRPGAAVIFPGQGSQRPGMASDFHQRFEAARRVFEEASEACGMDVGALCFQGDERLGLTEFAQPAILTAEIAMYRAIANELGWRASYFGGHSLGEYTALVASGALPLANAVRIVRQRGRLMQDAVPVGEGSMLAVKGDSLDVAALERVIGGLEVVIANHNSIQQVVLSGRVADLKQFGERLATSDVSAQLVELDVSAPFHSPLLEGITQPFSAILADETGDLNAEHAACVTSNVTGVFHQADAAAVRDRLARQISGRVRWRDNMRCIAEVATQVVEVGPDRPLRGFFRTVGVDVPAVTSVRAAERVFAQG